MIGILTDPAVGGTFIAWSIYYLRGDANYFNADLNTQIKLIHNPLTNMNAHNFKPNQPNRGIGRGLKKLYSMVDRLLETELDEVIYLHNFDVSAETASGVKYLSAKADKIILVSSKKYPLYHCGYSDRSGGQWISPTEYTTDPDVAYENFVAKFFPESYQLFQDCELTAIWDRREFIALNFKPYLQNLNCIEHHFDPAINHCLLDIAEIYNTDTHIIHIFDYLNIEICKARHNNWKQVYQQWQKLHNHRMLFVIYFDQIINYIINGFYLDLTRFNLDIVQEATIQQELIYKYNLNFKTWQLEKFLDTKQLHNLLESNIHHCK